MCGMCYWSREDILEKKVLQMGQNEGTEGKKKMRKGHDKSYCNYQACQIGLSGMIGI